ncbi:hypothetical protein HZB88_01940 [archaeon]|nr:hypothetical protein [archaeon]
MDRRQFNKIILGVGLTGLAILAFPDCKNEIKPKMKNKIRVADSHAHFRRIDSGNDFQLLLDTALDNVSWQAISETNTYLSNTTRMNYEKFRGILHDFIKSGGYASDFLILFSDEYATILANKRNNAKTIFYKSQEIESFSPYSKEHLIHLVAEGTENISHEQDAFKVIEQALKADASIMLAHPYAVECGAPKFFRYPEQKEEKTLEEIANISGIFIEAFNSNNITFVPFLLDMGQANPKAKALAEKYNCKLLANTDSHPSSISFQCSQIGLAGIEELPILDYKSMTGKEILQWKRQYLLNNSYKLKEELMPWLTFAFVMAMNKILG